MKFTSLLMILGVLFAVSTPVFASGGSGHVHHGDGAVAVVVELWESGSAAPGRHHKPAGSFNQSAQITGIAFSHSVQGMASIQAAQNGHGPSSAYQSGFAASTGSGGGAVSLGSFDQYIAAGRRGQASQVIVLSSTTITPSGVTAIGAAGGQYVSNGATASQGSTGVALAG